MALTFSGAARAFSPLATLASATRSTSHSTRKARRPWLADRSPALDDRLLRDIGLSRADLAAFGL